jgi:hypothetical protein
MVMIWVPQRTRPSRILRNRDPDRTSGDRTVQESLPPQGGEQRGFGGEAPVEVGVGDEAAKLALVKLGEAAHCLERSDDHRPTQGI